MAPRKRKTPETQETPALCAEHFPYGLGDQPEDATQVSCGHGTWNVADVKESTPEDPEDPEDPPTDPPKDPENPDGGKGDGSGEGDGK